jgi:hypothetical protein
MRRLSLVTMFAVGCASAGEDPRSSPADAMTTRHDAAIDSATGSNGSNGSNTSNPCAFSGVLATYAFAGETGSQTQTVATTMATGVTAGPLKRAATLTATSGANSINSTNWPTAAQVDLTKFYTFTISPPSSCGMTISTIAIDVKSSGTGPATGALATSSDNFATFKTVSTGAPSTVTASVTSSGMLEVRVYGYGASSTGGTMRVQSTLTINGSLQ